MAALSSGMPSTSVYLVRPSFSALMAASLMFSGVSKSGSPADSRNDIAALGFELPRLHGHRDGRGRLDTVQAIGKKAHRYDLSFGSAFVVESGRRYALRPGSSTREWAHIARGPGAKRRGRYARRTGSSTLMVRCGKIIPPENAMTLVEHSSAHAAREEGSAAARRSRCSGASPAKRLIL